jgi:hypothetical protein
MMRQVLVKTSPPTISVLSGIVTSATKAALFVQSGAFGGLVACGVAEDSTVAAEVTDGSAVTLASGPVVFVAATAGVAATVGVAVSPPEDWLPQAVRIVAVSMMIWMMILPFIVNLHFSAAYVTRKQTSYRARYAGIKT